MSVWPAESDDAQCIVGHLKRRMSKLGHNSQTHTIPGNGRNCYECLRNCVPKHERFLPNKGRILPDLLGCLDIPLVVGDASDRLLFANRVWLDSNGFTHDQALESSLSFVFGWSNDGDNLEDRLGRLDNLQSFSFTQTSPIAAGESTMETVWECTTIKLSDDDKFFIFMPKAYSELHRLNTSLAIAEGKLAGYRKKLETKGEALREILSAVEDEKKRLAQTYGHNLERIAIPLLRQLADKVSDVDRHSLEVIESSLTSVMTPVLTRLEAICPNLTSREIQICGIIRQGYSSKQIASILSLSDQTIHSHRRSIRRKLNLIHKRMSLDVFLRRLEQGSTLKNSSETD